MIDHGSELPAGTAKGVQRIRNSAERMGRLILDLLAYTELSRENFQKRPVDLDAAVTQSLRRLFADEIESTHAEISIELSTARILGDPTGIERVLVNLITNALKFSSPDRPLCLRILSEAEPPNVRVCIIDNGIGIDPRYRERIFGVFERLTPADNPGTGIGLAIVKRGASRKWAGTVGTWNPPSESKQPLLVQVIRRSGGAGRPRAGPRAFGQNPWRRRSPTRRICRICWERQRPAAANCASKPARRQRILVAPL